MIRSEITMTGGGGEAVAPAIGAREERDSHSRRRAFALPAWFNIAATVAVSAAVAVGVLIQG